MPGGKVKSCAEVQDAASGSQDNVRQETLGGGLGGIVEVREEDDGTAFPAFVVPVEVDLC